MNIGILLNQRGTLDAAGPRFVMGDELIACCWGKALRRRQEVARAEVFAVHERPPTGLDVVIHFQPGMAPVAGARNVLYLQNAFPPETYPGGTVGTFERVKGNYNGFLFPSERLRQACGGDGLVVPFATDREVFSPHVALWPPYPVSFVGNNIRSEATNQQFIEPALADGLVVFGGGWTGALGAACRGKVPAWELPHIYSRSLVNLNAHVEEHRRNDVVNLRVFDILACGAFCVSDPGESLEEWLGEGLVATEGGEALAEVLAHYLREPAERRRIAETGRTIVLMAHTYEYRVESIVRWLRE